MPSGGRLTIETSNVTLGSDSRLGELAPGDYVCLAVSDTGCGIGDEALAHIFEPFFSTKGPGKGTGLGLSTVYGIVKQSNGYIAVRTREGEGTHFSVYLPREHAPLPPSETEGDDRRSQGSGSILLVEDSDIVRRVTRRILERGGYTVIEAANGFEALARLDHATFDLLLTDVVMPDLSGTELAEKVRRVRPDIQVLFMSGYTDGAISDQVRRAPGFVFLEKPFTSETLLGKVREALGLGNRAVG